MTDQKWTKEPWRTKYFGAPEIWSSEDLVITTVDGTENFDINEANAAHIVQCVNACAGMGEPEKDMADIKEEQADYQGLTMDYFMLKSQRDALLEACGEAINVLLQPEYRLNSVGGVRTILRNAIAAVKDNHSNGKETNQ